MSANNGGPAFPIPQSVPHEQEGMTLRDYFAAKAMQATIDQKDVHDGREWDNAAWIAYQIADAMLKAREA